MTEERYFELAKIENEALRLKNKGQLKEAARLFQSILDEAPEWEEGKAQYWLAQCLEDINRTDDARSAYLKAIEIDPSYTDFIEGYGNFLQVHGEADEAFTWNLEALRMAQSFSESRQGPIKAAVFELGKKLGLSEEEISDRIAKSLTQK